MNIGDGYELRSPLFIEGKTFQNLRVSSPAPVRTLWLKSWKGKALGKNGQSEFELSAWLGTSKGLSDLVSTREC